MLIGLAAVKAAGFETQPSAGEAGSENVGGNVRGIFLVMAESGDGVLQRGRAMWKGDGANGGIAHGRGIEAEQGVGTEGLIVEGGELHNKVVRVLAVGDGEAVSGFSLLEEQRVLAAGDGGGFE